MHSDDGAQASIDFLTAISIFLLTFAYLMMQIPSIFAPFQTQSTDLQPVAYRTAMILAEDPGGWCDGTDWENNSVSLDDVHRIGLAANKHDPSNFSRLMNRGKTCLLSESKIKKLNTIYNSNATRAGYLLGLDIIRTYSYNISLQYLNGTTAEPRYIPNNTNPVLCIGNQIPETGEVEKMERLVAIEGNCSVEPLNIDDTNTSNITLSTPQLDSFTVKFEDFADKNRTADARLKVILNNTDSDYNNATVINKSGIMVSGWHQFNKTVIDDLCEYNEIRMNVSWCNVSYMWVNRSDWGCRVGDMSMPSAKLVVCIW